ncbi:hypothetical protein I7I51_04261 [Histoplasma capsulatum]|uniref:Uncharacterized protein n=1 Tax=Ajellomyces capsulatus TaxID=5037 RepID=A0A8A1MBU4_AJECA|nr:hypothetical protein I7I51_04261 [Histoplasma capsulatum]
MTIFPQMCTQDVKKSEMARAWEEERSNVTSKRRESQKRRSVEVNRGYLPQTSGRQEHALYSPTVTSPSGWMTRTSLLQTVTVGTIDSRVHHKTVERRHHHLPQFPFIWTTFNSLLRIRLTACATDDRGGVHARSSP